MSAEVENGVPSEDEYSVGSEEPTASKGEHDDGDDEDGGYRVYWQRWIMLLYMSILNLLSDWTCYSVAPISVLTAEAFGAVDPESLVVVFLGANGIATAAEPIILRRLGLRKTIVFGALLLMLGSFVKSGGIPLIMESSLEKGKGEWRVYVGFFLVGLSQPLYQCTPALLSASWFPEKERTMATGVALNSNQLGIGCAFVFGTLLVATSDDIVPYFELLSFIAMVTFIGCAIQFDDAPPTPPSETARVMRGTLTVNMPTLGDVANFVTMSIRGGLPSGLGGVDASSSAAASGGGGVAPAPSPAFGERSTKGAMLDIAVLEREGAELQLSGPMPSPMMDGRVGGTGGGADPDPNHVEFDEDSYSSTSSEDDGAVGNIAPQMMYQYPQGAVGYYTAPDGQVYYAPHPPAMQQPGAGVAVDPEEYYHQYGAIPYQQPPPYPQYGAPPPPQTFDPTDKRHLFPQAENPIDEGAEPVLIMTPHHLDIDIRDDQILQSLRACFSRPGFMHALVAFTVSGIVINTLSTYMDYLVRLGGAGREYVGIVGGLFQLLIMISSLIIGGYTDKTRAYYSVIMTMLVLGAFALAECGVSLDADAGNNLRLALLVVAVLVGPLQPVSTELGVDVVYPLSENTVLVIQQLFSNLLSACFIPFFKALKDVGINTSDDESMSEQPQYTFSFYLLIVLHATVTIYFATFNGRYLRLEAELEKKRKKEEDAAERAFLTSPGNQGAGFAHNGIGYGSNVGSFEPDENDGDY